MRLAWCLAAMVLPWAIFAADFDAATATNQVGLDLFRQLLPTTRGDLVISPYSIESALVLAFAGADGQTRSEMARALHLPSDDAAVQRSFGGLRKALDAAAAKGTQLSRDLSRHGPKTYAVMDGKRVELKEESPPAITWQAANRLFAQEGYEFREEFLAHMREGYEAPMQPLDFRRNSADAIRVINDWVSAQTHEKIRELIPGGGLTRETRLVLVNAFYLKAAWATAFVPAATKPERFHFPTGPARSIPTMIRGGNLPYADESGLEVVTLDYVGQDLQCVLLLPAKGRTVEDVVQHLSAADFARWSKLRDRPSQKLVLHLPKFRAEGATIPLGRELRTLGLTTAFDEPRGSANFDRIARRRDREYLALSDVFHRTFVALDEEGTEAAAATASVVMLGAMADYTRPIEVRFDRPFIFAIQHRASGLCLFVGRITEPKWRAAR